MYTYVKKQQYLISEQRESRGIVTKEEKNFTLSSELIHRNFWYGTHDHEGKSELISFHLWIKAEAAL